MSSQCPDGITRDELAEQARLRLSYSKATGILKWKLTTSRKVRPGDEAGSISKQGYIWIRICGKNVPAHRLAWAIVTGGFPECEIDHVNGVKSDNRWINLRLATHAQNSCNRPPPSSNTSGYKGVYWFKRTGKWIAYITHNKTRIHIGYFDSKTDAAKARAKAAKQLHDKFARETP